MNDDNESASNTKGQSTRRDWVLRLLGTSGAVAALGACVEHDGSMTGSFSHPLSNGLANAIETLGDLRALTEPNGTSDPEVYILLGHSAEGDGGGGVFYWDSSSTETDDDGLILEPDSMPTAGRWRRAYSGPMHVHWWGPDGSGATDSQPALQAAFDAAENHVLVFDKPADVYRVASQLTIRANTRILSAGATLEIGYNVSRPSVAVLSEGRVSADLIRIHVPAGYTVDQALETGMDDAIERIELTSASQQANLNGGSGNRDGAVRIYGGSARFGSIQVSNFDRAIAVYQAAEVLISHVDIASYVVGIKVISCSHFSLLAGTIKTASGNAGALAGHNGLLFEDTNDVTVSNVRVQDSGEHGIRVGGLESVERFAFSNIQITRPGRSGLKIIVGNGNCSPACDSKFADHIQINGLTVVDASNIGAAPVDGGEGLRLEKCRHVSVSGFQVQKDSNSYSCYKGVLVKGCYSVKISNPKIYNAYDDGIHLLEGHGYDVNEIYIGSPVIVVAGGDGIRVDSGTRPLRDIVVVGCYIRAHSYYGIYVNTQGGSNPVKQPCVFDGYVESTGSGTYGDDTSDSDIHYRITSI